MRIANASWFGIAIFALSITQFATPARADADTYQVLFLSSDQGYFFSGMDAQGDVVIDNTSGPSVCDFQTCYQTYVNGLPTSQTATPPSLVLDNGSPCTPTLPAGESFTYAVCNNGRAAFGGFLTPGQMEEGVYTGPSSDPSAITLAGDARTAALPFIYINSQGDVVFDNVFTENWYEAIDLTTQVPEPANLLLISTGILALAALRARRSTSPHTSRS